MNKLPNGGQFVQFKDGEILYLPNSTIYFKNIQELRWAYYNSSCENKVGEDIWVVKQDESNQAFLLDGYPQLYILEANISIPERYSKKFKERFVISGIEFIMESYCPGKLIAVGTKKYAN